MDEIWLVFTLLFAIIVFVFILAVRDGLIDIAVPQWVIGGIILYRKRK